MDVLERFLTAAALILAVFAAWITVQYLARRVARRHPEYGPARDVIGCGLACGCEDPCEDGRAGRCTQTAAGPSETRAPDQTQPARTTASTGRKDQ